MSNKHHTIRGMRLPDMRKLIEDTLDQINQIQQGHQKLMQAVKILDERDLVAELQAVQGQADKSLGEIRSFRDEIYEEGEDGEDPIKDRIRGLVAALRAKEKEFAKAKLQALGGKFTDDDGNEKELAGYLADLRHKLNGYMKKYDDLYEKIQRELVSGVTTVSMSKAFNLKAAEYKKSRILWQSGMFSFFAIGLGYSVYFYTKVHALSGQEMLLSSLQHIPIAGIFVSLMVFMGNRRAENKKLEEVYNHKEAMANSYVGYKKSIEELADADQELLKELMRNLLNAIKKDPSKFLKSKGEEPTAVEAAKQVVSKGNG